MILLLDIGNTRIKWLLREGDQAHAQGILPRTESPLLPELEQTPAAVWVSSVAGADWESQFRSLCQTRWQIEPWFAQSAGEQLGLKNSYAEPARMGVDRWLAMLSAWHRTQDAVCIVDAGSALTIDIVSLDGKHVGGYIIPGLDSMERALLTDTDRVRFSDAPRDSLVPGCRTEEAVYNGLLLSQAGAVALALDRYAGSARVLFTGGNGALLMDALRMSGELVEDLVFEGLYLAGQELA